MAGNKVVISAVKKSLADTYTLYLKTQNYHWNVTGCHFHSLHLMFEGQYNALAEAADELAERIRALGDKAPGSFQAFSELATMSSEPVEGDWKAMVQDLIKNHEIAVKTLYDLQSTSAKEGDVVTEDLAIERLAEHEKTIWMLQATLD